MSLDPTTPSPALGVPDTARGFLFDLDDVLTQTAKQHGMAWKLVFDSGADLVVGDLAELLGQS